MLRSFFRPITRLPRNSSSARYFGAVNSQFTSRAENVLNCIHSVIEDNEIDCDDINYQDGVLSVSFENKGIFIINLHSASQQIWYASPVSGPYYFDSSNHWLSKVTGKSLSETFRDDLKKITGEDLNFDKCVLN